MYTKDVWSLQKYLGAFSVGQKALGRATLAELTPGGGESFARRELRKAGREKAQRFVVRLPFRRGTAACSLAPDLMGLMCCARAHRPAAVRSPAGRCRSQRRAGVSRATLRTLSGRAVPFWPDAPCDPPAPHVRARATDPTRCAHSSPARSPRLLPQET